MPPEYIQQSISSHRRVELGMKSIYDCKLEAIGNQFFTRKMQSMYSAKSLI